MAYRSSLVAVALVATLVGIAEAREIRLPDEAPVQGNVLVAEAFTRTTEDGVVPIEYPAWPGSKGMKPSTWFSVRIEAHPGDVLILAPGEYDAEIWIFTPGVTVCTDPAASELAVIRGTIEVDADGVLLEHLSVTASKDPTTSGHGIEVNRVYVRSITIRDLSSSDNPWTGIHIIGTEGAIEELRVERCALRNNGMDGMDSISVRHLVVIGCTITGNGWNLSTGVGIRVGRFVENLELVDNVVTDNRYADVYRPTE
ncbi:MAG: right-handed parallel beta-helix repeat-containing protein [Candidatus Bipolaricaulota bacterium]|nr:right-handed parallel beta-helix repeat-containing protein [Candidatus Bipolaricaulota bacterium]